MKTIQVNAMLTWRASRGETEWVASCDPLGLVVQAETWASLMRVIDEVLRELMIDLMEEGDLQTFLRSHGWTLVGADALSVKKGQTFDIPFQIETLPVAHATA